MLRHTDPRFTSIVPKTYLIKQDTDKVGWHTDITVAFHGCFWWGVSVLRDTQKILIGTKQYFFTSSSTGKGRCLSSIHCKCNSVIRIRLFSRKFSCTSWSIWKGWVTFQQLMTLKIGHWMTSRFVHQLCTCVNLLSKDQIALPHITMSCCSPRDQAFAMGGQCKV